MYTGNSSYSRSALFLENKGVQSQSFPTSEHTPERGHQPHVCCNKDCPQHCLSGGRRDWHCPVCLQTAVFPVETNCGHLFCAPCLIAYWRHGTWLGAISCPLCRQKVSVLCHLFSESRTDREEKRVMGDIRDYNKRYSGAPRRVADYLYDTPLFLHLLLRGMGNMSGLVWLFFLRVAVCCFGAVMSLASPLEAVPEPFCGVLGLLDDLVVVFLLLICVLNINQQMGTDRAATARTATRGVLTDSL
ncbi:RING-HC_RNF170 domain-containing protein [Megalops cyprinoides]|uniref:RING-HC_RNF170 domain-containing protein n=1 Tax=Megalops cyprinoides TaxID=118141 RepID=UPI001863E4C0|nr:RING-HC_RNF170 domain-containing protein [Megalops cyprinoides]